MIDRAKTVDSDLPSNRVMRYVVSVGACLLVLGLTGILSTGLAQDREGNFTDLSLEELIRLEVIPIEVMGTHVHGAGEWMVGYRASYMQMEPHGDDHHGEEHGEHMMEPAAMGMGMHMVELMYGITDRLTVMAMIPYERLRMESLVPDGSSTVRRSRSVGDLQIMSHYALYKKRADYLIGKIGVSVPTGSIDVQGTTPGGSQMRLPYPMQVGAGTYGFVGEATYIDQHYQWAWGVRARARGWWGRNAHSYRPGNEYHLGVWVTRRLTRWMAPFLHADVNGSRDVVGADPQLDPAMTPAADPDRQGGLHAVLEPGLSFYIPRGPLEGQRLALKAPVVVYERHEEGLLAHSWQLSLTWQWTF